MVLDLPPGWERRSLGSLGTWQGGGTPSKEVPEFWLNGSIPWVSPKDMKVSQMVEAEDHITEAAVAASATNVIPANAVLVVTRSGILRHSLPVALTMRSVAINQDIRALTLASGNIPAYIYWAFRRYEREILQDCSKDGTTVQSIEFSRLQSFEMPVPSIDEQRRIVAAIEQQMTRVSAGIASLQTASRRLERQRESVLWASTLGRFSDAWGKEEMSLDASIVQGEGKEVDELPTLLPGWSWSKLGQVASIAGGVTKDARKEAAADLVEVPYLRVANVQRGHLDLRNVTTIRVPAETAIRLELQNGDVLLNEGGDRDKLGRGWVWEGQIQGCIHQNHVFRARLKVPGLDPKFVSWHGNTFGRAWFDRHGSQTTNLASISMSKLKELPIPIPPANQMRAIVAETERQLTLIDQTSDSVKSALARSEQLRQAILSAAFKGHLVSTSESPPPVSMLAGSPS